MDQRCCQQSKEEHDGAESDFPGIGRPDGEFERTSVLELGARNWQLHHQLVERERQILAGAPQGNRQETRDEMAARRQALAMLLTGPAITQAATRVTSPRLAQAPRDIEATAAEVARQRLLAARTRTAGDTSNQACGSEVLGDGAVRTAILSSASKLAVQGSNMKSRYELLSVQNRILKRELAAAEDRVKTLERAALDERKAREEAAQEEMGELLKQLQALNREAEERKIELCQLQHKPEALAALKKLLRSTHPDALIREVLHQWRFLIEDQEACITEKKASRSSDVSETFQSPFDEDGEDGSFQHRVRMMNQLMGPKAKLRAAPNIDDKFDNLKARREKKEKKKQEKAAALERNVPVDECAAEDPTDGRRVVVNTDGARDKLLARRLKKQAAKVKT